jgi:hypothetical protein
VHLPIYRFQLVQAAQTVEIKVGVQRSEITIAAQVIKHVSVSVSVQIGRQLLPCASRSHSRRTASILFEKQVRIMSGSSLYVARSRASRPNDNRVGVLLVILALQLQLVFERIRQDNSFRRFQLSYDVEEVGFAVFRRMTRDQFGDANPQTGAVNVILASRATFGCRPYQPQCFLKVIGVPELRMIRDDARQFVAGGQCAAGTVPVSLSRGDHRLGPILPQGGDIALWRIDDPLDQRGERIEG